MCNDLEETAKEEMYSGSTVEFGFMNNSLGVDGPFIGPGATFDPAKEENLPTITARHKKDSINIVTRAVKLFKYLFFICYNYYVVYTCFITAIV